MIKLIGTIPVCDAVMLATIACLIVLMGIRIWRR